MSQFIIPSHRKDRKGKFLFCFNPYPSVELVGQKKHALDGYLTEDDAKNLLETWGIKTLKKCVFDKERIIKEDGASWPFYGLPLLEGHKLNQGKSLYQEFKDRKLI